MATDVLAIEPATIDEIAAIHPGGSTDRVAPSWGGPLLETDYAALEKSWITRDLADAAMLRRVNAQEGREAICQKGTRDCAGILFPVYWPSEAHARCYRIRRDNPDWIQGKDGSPKPERKYLGEPKSGNHLYLPPGITAELLDDPAVPLVIVEGEKKALSLQRLAYHETASPRFVPIGIFGVWNWRGTVGKTGGPKGERLDVKGPITDLNRIAWEGRTVYVLFDANVSTNDSVKWARKGLHRELTSRRAKVRCINMPEGCGVNGVDDLLYAWGPDRVLELFEQAPATSTLHVIAPPQFRARPEGMFRVTTRGEQLVELQLSNYQAQIVTNICLDDGVETKREFEVRSELAGRSFRFTIPANQFSAMDWPLEQMGPHAITFPNQREYARTAIQSFSLTAEERTIYTHSGWTNVDGRWIFLHAGGAIGQGGVIADVDVRLPRALIRFELGIPPNGEPLKRAIRSSLKLLEVLPPMIGFAVFAALCRAVFGGADFALHIAGETGAFKSELAALVQQFFGASMDRTHLPGSWASTGNALEMLVFHAKDVLVVIDDFAPQGSSTDVARYHAAADRVFRAAGNQAGRGRLDSTARLREPKPPRGLVLSTGEDVPRGHSIRARLLILELTKGQISATVLSECQAAARAGEYAAAMAGFIRWMAAKLEIARQSLEERAAELRRGALTDPAHARTPDTIANLQAAFEAYLQFCVDAGAIDAGEQDQQTRNCWRALRTAAIAQTKHHAASEPAARFVSLMRACLSSGQAHLAARDGTVPKEIPEDCGWRREGDTWSPCGRRIGWADKGDIYIEPTTAYQVTQVASRDLGDSLPVSEQVLKKRLKEKGLLASTDERRETITIRRTLSGSQKDVLHFRRTTLLPEGEDE